MAPYSNQKTLKQLARHMDLSLTTVSRVLSGQSRKYRISQKTEDAVLAEAARLDFSPNQVAKSLRLQQTQTLGLIIPDVAKPFFSTLARSVELEARRKGYSVFLCDSEESSMIEMELLHQLNSRSVDGFIVSPVGQSCSHFEELYKKNMPVVVVDRYFPKMKLPYITSDNYKGSLEGANHLIENGHRNIACIQGIPECTLNMDRVKGYRDALTAKNIPVNETMIVGSRYDQRNGYIETKLLLKRNPRPSAIYTMGSSIAFGALSAIMEEGLKVPDDISILSFDDQPFFPYLATPLTAIAQESEAMGELAVKLLLNQIELNGEYEPERIMLPTRLNIRDSVRKME